jgi:ABC-type nitrate/sulfonate/bicarbonate transport system permease component
VKPELKNRLFSLLIVAAVLLGWELVSRLHLVSTIFLPPATVAFKALFANTLNGTIPFAAASTLGRALSGYFIAAAVGIGLGLGMGLWRPIRRVCEPVVELLRPIPSAAIIPVAILFLGIDDAMKIAVIVFACAWPILLNTLDGVLNIEPVLLETAQVFRLRCWHRVRAVIIPAAAPGIVTGLRISLAISLILAVTVEMLAGNNGLGFLILDTERSFQYADMYAAIIAIGLIGLGANWVFVKLTRPWIHWHGIRRIAEI